jgi:hypothetical protein
MTTTFKLFNANKNDGSTFIDLPFSGKVVGIFFSLMLISSVNEGRANAELSRSPTNQHLTNNPRGVLLETAIGTPSAGPMVTQTAYATLEEPVKAGERLYLNCAGGITDADEFEAACFVTISG